MPTPTHLDELLEDARIKTLEETNAQAVFENLRKLKEFHAIHRRRWIWELLQNAADATDSTGHNRVNIQIEPNRIRFSHNGSAFNRQEITHLIYHGSTKQEDESKKGKFGSGFLTIHLISRKVRIKGVLKEGQSESGFEFYLDRSGDSSQLIQQNMEVAWKDFMGKRSNRNGNEEFTTSFECELDDDAGVVVESGLADLAKAVPFVLALVDEFQEITVANADGKTTWRKVNQKPVDGLTLAEIVSQFPDGHSEMMRVAISGDHVNGVALAVLLRQRGEQWEVVVDDATPRLFYPLPLVDTHDLPIPFAIVSDSFEPTEERNGILASTAGETADLTEKNWKLLGQVPAIFNKLINVCVREKWLESHKLATFMSPPAKEWINARRFISEVLGKNILFLRGKDAPALVCTANDRRIPISEAVIPIKDTSGEIFTLAKEITALKERLPTRKTSNSWAKILEGWAEVLGMSVEQLDEALTAEKLAGRISQCKNLVELGAALSSDTGANALVWLNRLFCAVPPEQLQSFIRNRSLLPNQQGHLKKEGELRLDVKIDQRIKDICEKLNDPIRTLLLHEQICQPIVALFEGVNGRSLSNDECVERALKRLKEKPPEDVEEAYEANAQLLRWLIENNRTDKLAGYVALCAEDRSELRADKPLLVPVSLWDNEAQDFADLFPESRRLDDRYTQFLEETHWRCLGEKNLLWRSLFISEPVETFEHQQTEEDLSGDVEHKPLASAMVSQIAFFRGDGGVLDEVRKSKQKGRRLLQFLLNYVIKFDRSWSEAKIISCSCGKDHRVLPAWMYQLKNRDWVSLGRKGDRPTAENISALLDEELTQTILSDSDCAEFLLKLGIGVSELLRFRTPPEKRSQLDRLSAKIYAASDPSTLASIEIVLDDPEIRDAVLNKRQEKEKVLRNQKVGKIVEELLQKELQSVGFRVERTGVGSDFELESDFVENGVEQLLKVNRYLLEVKSTSASNVRMTLRQGEEAIKPEKRENYVLCVVDVSGGNIDEQVVRENVRFVFGMGDLLEAKVNAAKGLKDLEQELNPSDGGAIQIDIIESSVKLRIASQIWNGRGLSFQQFVERVKQ